MVLEDTKISPTMKSKRWLSVEKILQNEKKRLTIIYFSGNYKKLILFGKFCFFG